MTLETFKPLIEAVLLGASGFYLALFFSQVALLSAMVASGKVVGKFEVSLTTLYVATLFFAAWVALQ